MWICTELGLKLPRKIIDVPTALFILVETVLVTPYLSASAVSLLHMRQVPDFFPDTLKFSLEVKEFLAVEQLQRKRNSEYSHTYHSCLGTKGRFQNSLPIS